jgi:CRISPR-associated protein Cmr2
MMGPEATVSGGLALVHYKYDLRQALDAARDAEKKAKGACKDALGIKVCRRSGEHSQAVCPWDRVPWLVKLTEAFKEGASDRFAYHLARELPTLEALPPEAVAAEIGRLAGRTEQGSRLKLTGKEKPREAGAVAAEWFEAYRQAMDKRGMQTAEALKAFVVLCQAAAFLARGRDE